MGSTNRKNENVSSGNIIKMADMTTRMIWWVTVGIFFEYI